tara:strand:- start:299 stop:484 length:186 start_codon:yes stop_codon:yes gene_type:complete
MEKKIETFEFVKSKSHLEMTEHTKKKKIIKPEKEWMKWKTCYECGGMKNYQGLMFIECKCK